MTPTISIIIPVYNTEKYLRRCLDSVVAQTYIDFECILVDDGSTDGSGKICDEYAAIDKRFKAYHNLNRGPSKERNFGLEHSNGEYVIFIDSDDWLENDALDIYANAIEKYNPDIIKTGYKIDTPINNKKICCVDKVIVPIDKVDLFLDVEKSGYTGFIWNSAFRRKTIGNLRFSEKFKWCEDQLFSLEMFNNCKSIVLVPGITYHYMVEQGDSLSNVKDAQLVFDVTQKGFDLKYMMAGKSHEALSIMTASYNYLVNYSVRLLYQYYSRSQRVAFKKKNTLKSNVNITYWQLRIFFSEYPIYLVDIILIAYLKYNNYKREIKTIIKKIIR